MKWRLVWLFSVLILSISCATTKLGEVWELEGYDVRPFERLMIVGLAKTPELRSDYENGFVDRLANERIFTLASINMVPDVADIDRETVDAWVAEYELDAVFVTRVVNASRDTIYRPPTQNLYGRYGAWGASSYPGSVTQTVKVSLETSIYDVKTGQLVFSVLSKTYNPNGGREMFKAVRNLVVADLMTRGYLKTKRP